LSYRLAAFDDALLADFTELWVAAWSNAMPAIDFEARRAWFVDHLAAMRAQGVAVTCAFDEEGALAGFITLDRASGHIDQLAVAPGHWSKGAAAALLDEAKRRAPGTLKLDVNQDNPRAMRFYEKHGFRRRAAGVNPTSGLKTWRYEWSG
jgi:putative acetyltransferase